MPIPQHINSDRASGEFQWSGTDTQARWDENWKNKNNRDFLRNLRDFKYHYNSHGFRTAEFTDEACILALGCSHTEGVGVPIGNTWPSVLEAQSNNTVYNLGVGGSGIDTVYRLLVHYAIELNTLAVVINVPPAVRFEIKTEVEWETVSVHSSNQSHFMKTWFLHDENSDLHQEKTVAAIQWFCYLNDIPLTLVYADDEQYIDKTTKFNQGRDLMHHGKQYHCNVATAIHSQLKQQFDQNNMQ